MKKGATKTAPFFMKLFYILISEQHPKMVLA